MLHSYSLEEFERYGFEMEKIDPKLADVFDKMYEKKEGPPPRFPEVLKKLGNAYRSFHSTNECYGLLPEEEKFLSTASVDDYYKFLKGKRKHLASTVQSCLACSTSETQYEKERIGKVEAALEKIAAESLLNKLRVESIRKSIEKYG